MTRAGEYRVFVEALRDHAGKYRSGVAEPLRNAAGAAGQVGGGDAEMFGPLLSGLGVSADLAECGRAVAEQVAGLAKLTEQVSVNMYAAADDYEAAEESNKGKIERIARFEDRPGSGRRGTPIA
ncbi:type VII secretion target [Phytomonospora endophytica]|uniref:Excreted virulence factor EspC (Type VII ESX diderm) n=1 Tax=Phytomonospora endophytica TaxID=714109 RepID=A0A841FTT6_9ACTN|nr:type VII secretion target [Phytomonospora endophytica]MBB6035390.1 hypothetical protein [Phytomonospora endophytica]GIG63858.1 hypothetical protein Pen01_01530 [Phytomonospora endophytica]